MRACRRRASTPAHRTSKSVLAVGSAILAACACFAESPSFQGAVKRGQHFRYATNVGLVFGLDPTDASHGCEGWHIWVGPSESQPYFADLATGPPHGLSTLDICASDFRDSDNSGPNLPGPKNVNRPGKLRNFQFVTSAADADQLYKAVESRRSELLPKVKKGTLRITGLSLGQLKAGTKPTIERMQFTVELDIQ
jgi:hypothetical protein